MRLFVLCWIIALQSAVVLAQETGVYSIVSISGGNIVDKKTGKELNVGDRVNLQTNLEFGSLYAKAVLINPSKTQKYWLSVPESQFAENKLTVSSDLALHKVTPRPIKITGTRGEAVDFVGGISRESMKNYFGKDTFTVIGNSLAMPVPTRDAKKYGIVFRFEQGNCVKDVSSDNFTISKQLLIDSQNKTDEISECFILLNDLSDNALVNVTTVRLCFVDEARLYKEFDALLKAFDMKPKSFSPAADKKVKEYCLEVYGNIDQKSLKSTVSKYFRQ